MASSYRSPVLDDHSNAAAASAGALAGIRVLELGTLIAGRSAGGCSPTTVRT
jgi:hypothetical protein